MHLFGANTQNEQAALCHGRPKMKSQLFFESPLWWLQKGFVKKPKKSQFSRCDSTWTRLSHLFKAALFSEPQNTGQQSSSRLIKHK